MHHDNCIGCPLMKCRINDRLCKLSIEEKLEVNRKLADGESQRLETRADKRIERLDRYSDPLKQRFGKYDGRGRWKRGSINAQV